MSTITLTINELTPTTLAAILANLLQNLAEDTTRQPYATRIAMLNAYNALIANCGKDDAADLLAAVDADMIELDAAMEAQR